MDTTYPLQTSFQINLTTNPRNPAKIAICDGCKSNPNACLTLAPISWRTIFKKKIFFSYLLTYQFRSLYWCKFFCWISIARRSNGVIPKTEENVHSIHEPVSFQDSFLLITTKNVVDFFLTSNWCLLTSLHFQYTWYLWKNVSSYK